MLSTAKIIIKIYFYLFLDVNFKYFLMRESPTEQKSAYF